MYKTVVWTVTFFGTAVGAFSAIMDGSGSMVVMGLVGAAFGYPLGAGLSALLMAFKRKSLINSSSENTAVDEESGTGIDPYLQMKTADQWIDDPDKFPIAGDLDSVARAMTASPDLTKLDKNQGF